MRVNCLVLGSQKDAWRPLLRSGYHSAYLLLGSLHQAGSVLGRSLDVIHTRPLLSSIGLCGSAGLYGGLAHRCSLPQCREAIAGLGNRDGTFSWGSRVGMSMEKVLFSFGSRTTSRPWPADTAYTGPPALTVGWFLSVEISSCMKEWS